MRLNDKVIKEIVPRQMTSLKTKYGVLRDVEGKLILDRDLYATLQTSLLDYQHANIGNEPVDWNLIKDIEQREKEKVGKGRTGGQVVKLRNAMSVFYGDNSETWGKEFTNNNLLEFLDTEGIEKIRNLGKDSVKIGDLYLKEIGRG